MSKDEAHVSRKLVTREEVESMLSYWRERLANAVRPKHIKHAGARVSELEKQLREMSHE